MISPYVRPQDTITQILQQTPAREASRRNPIVIGPQYELFLNDGRDLSASKLDFDVAGQSGLNYKTEAGVDLELMSRAPVAAEAKLYGENLQAEVADFAAAGWAIDSTDTAWRSIRVAADSVAGTGTLNSLLDGRQVRVGDVISSDWNDGAAGTGTTRRKVVGLLGKVTPAVVPATASAAGVYNVVTNGADLGEKVAAFSDTDLTVNTLAVVADIDVFQGHGYKLADTGGDLKLADTLDLVFTAGATTVSTVTITSTATGQSVTGVATTDPGAGEFEVDLTGVGYPGSTITIDRAGLSMSADDKIRVNVFPTFTIETVGSLTTGGTYAPLLDRRYAVEVVDVTGAGGTVDVKIFDVSGKDATVAFADAEGSAKAVGTSGVTVTIASGTYYKGQIFYFDFTARKISGVDFDGVVLDGPAVPAATMAAYPATTFDDTKIYQVYTGELDSTNTAGGLSEALTATTTDWAYAAALGLQEEDSDRLSVSLSLFQDGYGKVFVAYKALVKPSATEGMIELESTTNITDELGETKLENWLGRGALEAFRGNQKQVVYALRTTGDSVADFTTALRKIKTTDQVYALVGLTDDFDVMKLLRDHVDEMSNKYNKNFRRAYVGTDSPGAYVSWGELDGGGYRRADLSSSIVTLDAAYRDDWQFAAEDVGASITVQSIGLSFTILEVLSDYEVLTDAAIGLSATGSGIVITRADTPENQAAYVIDRSKSLSSRRISNVWSDKPTVIEGGATTVLPMKFVAAEVAGLRCALLPQQGLTLTEIQSVTAAPSMYTTFEGSVLDDVAANGTMVITQESEGGDIFIRHQLTTSTTEGALAYEDNVGVIVDEFSYSVKDEFRVYIGRRNATPDTIKEIDDKLKTIAADYTAAELVNRDIGPAVLAFFDEKGNEGDVTVRQDGDLADTLLTYVKLRVPLPLNGINHYIDVEVSELLASQDN